MNVRSTLARAIAGLTIAGSLLPVSAGILGTVAFAGTCSSGDVDLSIGVTTKDIGFTQELEVVTVPPRSSSTWSITRGSTFTVGVTGEASATFKAGAILAEASTTLKFSYHADNTTTLQTAVSVTANNTSSNYQDWVGFRGVQKATGWWKEYHCVAGSERLFYQGTWATWNQNKSGAIYCKDDATILSQYGSASLQYAAVRSC